MSTKTAYLLVACAAMLCGIATISQGDEPASQKLAIEIVPAEDETVEADPPQLQPLKESSPKHAEHSRQEPARIDVSRKAASSSPLRNVSLSMLDEEKKTILDDSVLSKNTCEADCDDCTALCVGQYCRQFWARADYMMWWTRGSKLPPLVTTSTNPDDNGVIGQPTTEILYGGSRENSGMRSSMRVTLGYWFDCRQCYGIQFDYFNLGVGPGAGDNSYYKDCSDDELISLPLYRVYPTPEGEAAELVCKEDVQQGRTRIDSGDYFDSFGILGRWNVCCHQSCCYDECGDDGCGDVCGPRNSGSVRHLLECLGKPWKTAYRIDLVAGYRNYGLDDLLGRHEHFVVIQRPGYPPGSTFDVQDSFRASNEFHGGELGVITTSYRGRWSLELLAKVALGNNSQSISIDGYTHVERPGTPPMTADFDDGVLALQTNSGNYHRDEFVAIPQLGIELGYCLTERTRVYFGYNIIYWPNVVRAAEQIDRNINLGYIPPVIEPVEGPEVPAFSFKDSDFWAQGLNLGLECHF